MHYNTALLSVIQHLQKSQYFFGKDFQYSVLMKPESAFNLPKPNRIKINDITTYILTVDHLQFVNCDDRWLLSYTI